MQKLHFSIQINAPVAKVWDTMLEDVTYRQWTKAFGADGYFKGDWSAGSKILFVGIDAESGKEMGMVSRIAANRHHAYISIEHLGIYADGVEDMTSEDARKWSPALENYTFTEKDGGTLVEIDQDMLEEYVPMFNQMWPEALNNLKALAEA